MVEKPWARPPVSGTGPPPSHSPTKKPRGWSGLSSAAAAWAETEIDAASSTPRPPAAICRRSNRFIVSLPEPSQHLRIYVRARRDFDAMSEHRIEAAGRLKPPLWGLLL